jgi:rhomboid protease GluP
LDLIAAGYVPPDPDEQPGIELWRLPGNGPPFVTLLLLLSWAVPFALLAVRGEGADPHALLAHGANVTQRFGADAVLRFVSSTFLHAGPGHVFFNALTLLMFGPGVERLFRRTSMLTLVAAGGAAASAASYFWRLAQHGVGADLSVGGSGVLFALGGALLAAAWRLRARLAVGRARALAAAVLFLAAQAYVGGFQHLGTDNIAHTGGLVAGVLLGLALPLDTALSEKPPGRTASLIGALGALVLLAGFARTLIER